MSSRSGRRKGPWLTLERRGQLYRVATAAGLLLAGYGIISDTDLPLWLGLAGALLGTGTASAFTPAKNTNGGQNGNGG